MRGFSLEQNTAYALLAEWNTRCLPPWSPAELAHKIQSACAAAATRPNGYLLESPVFPSSASPLPPPKWPAQDHALTARVIAAGPTALELWQRSPKLLDVDDGSNCEEIVSALFASPQAPDPLLCIGRSSREFSTRPLSEWLASGGLSNQALIVPSPMTARNGRTKGGKPSEHTLDNTGPRRFLVVEFDTGSEDDHAARLWYLARYGSLVLVVHSGGKSLHGWFACGHHGEEALRTFFTHAVALGADKAIWTRSQFVRLPAGQRDTGCRQSVFYFNPNLLQSNP